MICPACNRPHGGETCPTCAGQGDGAFSLSDVELMLRLAQEQDPVRRVLALGGTIVAGDEVRINCFGETVEEISNECAALLAAIDRHDEEWCDDAK